MLTIIGLWSPWRNIDIQISEIFGVESPEEVSGLQVISTSGEVELFFEGESQGTTNPESGPIIVSPISPGEKLVRIVRNSAPEGYYEFNRIINFVSGIDVVVSYELGPDLIFSEGSVITAKEQLDEDYNLLVTANISDYEISLDGVSSRSIENQFSSTISLERQHELRVEKNGYEPIELTLLPEDQEFRDKLNGFVINVDLNLLLQPVEVE